MTWIEALPLAELAAAGKAIVRHDGRQILLLHAAGEVYACANRCPHEGYPLSEGTLSDGCVLTCNWHNWKFDLASGGTLVGGDRLRRYPVQIEAGSVWFDPTPPDPASRRLEILDDLVAALRDNDQERLVREAARLDRLGVDPVDAIRAAIDFAVERLEFGTTHAIAGAPDWLGLFDCAPAGSAERLAALGEILGHLADDVMAGRGRMFPFAAGTRPWDGAGFAQAIEQENEAEAVALLRGALAGKMTPDDLAPTLFGAALAYYADFGHSLIYTTKTLDLARRLGPEAAEPLLLMLARSLIFATREDLLPEFRDYAPNLAGWGSAEAVIPALDPAALRRTSAKAAMALVRGWSARHDPMRIFSVLVEAGAWTLLHVDDRALTRVDGKFADNVGWLDFTHALTFADAALDAARVRPDLWPAILLQLACFIGRNVGYVDADLDTGRFAVTDIGQFVADRTAGLFDHGRERFIVSVHLTKTLLAGVRLMSAVPKHRTLIAAALHRFLDAPMKGRHVLRTARQMAELVDRE